MHLVGALVDRAHRPRRVRRRLGDRLLARAALADRKALAPVAEEQPGDRPVVEPAGRAPPRRRGDPGRGPKRVVLVLGRHREEAPVADEPRAFEAGLEVARKRCERRVVVRRPDDPGVERPFGLKVVDEAKRPRHEPAQAKRLDARRPRRLPGGRTRRRFGVDGKREGRVFDQLAEAEGAVRLARSDQSFPGLQGRGVDAEASRGARDELAAGGRRGEPDGMAGLLHRAAARGVALVGGEAGPGGRHHHAVEGHVEFPGRDEGDGGRDALPDLHLAGTHLDAAVGPDGDPVLHAGVRCEARVGGHRGAARARARTARNTLGWAPHRHRCGSSAARIALSPGCGSLRSSPVTATTIPGVQ